MDDTNALIQQRIDKLEQLRATGIEPYAYAFPAEDQAADLHTKFQDIDEIPEDAHEVCLAGRVMAKRSMGKIIFAHIQDGTGKIQLFVRRDEVGEEAYDFFKKDFDLGDFVEARGKLFRTRTGEISIHVTGLRMLAKAISPLPIVKEQVVDGKLVRYSAFSDIEERYRQRYADLVSNPEVRQAFWTRAQTVSALRRFLDERGFIEVETPVLQPVYGGAALARYQPNTSGLQRYLNRYNPHP